MNGQPITDEGLMTISGWTNNERMNLYETYDMTAHVQEAARAHGGAMAIGVSLGHGWRDQSKFPRKDPKEAAAGGDTVDKVFRAILQTTSQDGTTRTWRERCARLQQEVETLQLQMRLNAQAWRRVAALPMGGGE